MAVHSKGAGRVRQSRLHGYLPLAVMLLSMPLLALFARSCDRQDQSPFYRALRDVAVASLRVDQDYVRENCVYSGKVDRPVLSCAVETPAPTSRGFEERLRSGGWTKIAAAGRSEGFEFYRREGGYVVAVKALDSENSSIEFQIVWNALGEIDVKAHA